MTEFSVQISWRSYVSWAGKEVGGGTWTSSREEHYSPSVVEFYSLSSMADLFSAWLSMSLENHSLNSSWESNSVGMMKCSRAHSWETVITYSRQQFCLDLMNTHAPVSTHTHTHTAHLSHCVLDGRPSEQQSVSTLELQKDFPPNAEHTEKETLNVWRSGATTPWVYHVYSALNCAVITPLTQTVERCLCAQICFSFQDIFRLVL